MRSIGLVGLALALSAAPAARAAGTWTLKYSEGGGGVGAIGALDAQRAVAFGVQEVPGTDEKKMVWLRTTDGGANWDVTDVAGHAAGAMVNISEIVCRKPPKCVALATSIDMGGAAPKEPIANRLIVSADGGAKWVWPAKQWSNTWTFTHIDFASDQNVWLSGGANVVVRSTDGGKTFKFKVPEIGGVKFLAIQDMAFVSSTVGYAVNATIEEDDKGNLTSAAEGALLKTTDGGETWTTLFTGATEAYDRLEMVTEQAGWLVGRTAAGPFLRRTSDGGQNWTDVPIPQPAFTVPQASTPPVKWVNDLDLFDADNGFLTTTSPFGQDQFVHAIFEIRDGSLVEVAPDPANNVGDLADMSCAGPSLCWAGGGNLTLLKYEDTSVQPPSDSSPGADNAATPDAAGDTAGTPDVPGETAGQPDAVDGDAYVPRDLAGYWDTSGGGGKSGCAAGAVPGAAPAVPALLGLVALLAARFRRRT